jgi:glycosyl transferase family 25
MIPVIVISLERSADRRAAMQAHLAGINVPFAFFDAVDGATISATQRKALDVRPITRKYGRTLSQGEIGLAASWIQLLRTIGTGPNPFVCVLEDDARLLPGATRLMSEEFLSSLPQFDLIMLQKWRSEMGLTAVAIAEAHGYRVYAPYKCTSGTVGQIVSKGAAARLARHLRPLRAPVDEMLYADRAFRSRVLAVRPPPIVSAPGLPLEIGQGRSAEERANRKRPRWVAAKMVNGIVRRSRRLPYFVAAWGPMFFFRLRRFSWHTE